MMICFTCLCILKWRVKHTLPLWLEFLCAFTARTCGRLASRPAGRTGPGEKRSAEFLACAQWRSLHTYVELQ